MKLIIIIFNTILLSFVATGQTLEWVKQMGSTSNYEMADLSSNKRNLYLVASNGFGQGGRIVLIDTNKNKKYERDLGRQATRFGRAWINTAQLLPNSSSAILGGAIQGNFSFEDNHLQGWTATGRSDAFIERVNSLGKLVYYHVFKGSGEEKIIDIESNYAVGLFDKQIDFKSGVSGFSANSSGKEDFFLIQYSASGVSWVKFFGGLGKDMISGLKIDNNKIYLYGSFEGTLDADPGSTTKLLTSNGGSDAFIITLDLNGDYLDATNFGGSTNESVSNLAADNGELYYTIDYEGSFLLKDKFGFSKQVNHSGGLDFCTVKSNGQFKINWMKPLVGTGNNPCSGLMVDNASNEVLISGYFTKNFNYNPSNVAQKVSSIAYEDGFLVTLDTSGNFIDKKILAGLGSDKLAAVTSVKTGEAFVFGESTGEVTLHGKKNVDLRNDGARNVSVFKTSKSNEQLIYQGFEYKKSISSLGEDHPRVLSVSDNSVITIFSSTRVVVDVDMSDNVKLRPENSEQASSAKKSVFFMSCHDSLGNLKWDIRGVDTNLIGIQVLKSYNANEIYILGGLQKEGPTDLFFDGRFYSVKGIKHELKCQDRSAKTSSFVLKLDSTGEVVWSKVFCESSITFFDNLLIGANGEIYLVYGGVRGYKKLDPKTGQVLWSRRVSGISSSTFSYITKTGLGVLDKTPDPAIRYLLDSSASTILTDTLNEYAGKFVSLEQVTSSNTGNSFYCVSGFADSLELTVAGKKNKYKSVHDAITRYVWKYTEKGKIEWLKTFEDVSHVEKIYVDDEGHVILGGNFYGTSYFSNDSTSWDSVKSVSDIDAFVFALDTNGNFLWVRSIGGLEEDFMYHFGTNNNKLYSMGTFRDSLLIDSVSVGKRLLSSWSSQVFVSKHDMGPGAIKKPPFPIATEEVVEGRPSIQVYPNPSFGRFQVGIENTKALNGNEILLKVFTLNGAQVYSQKISNLDEAIFVNGLSNGTYIISLELNSQIFFEKVVVSN